MAKTNWSEAQRRVWQHNSHIGYAVMIQKQANAIADSPTSTEAAKSLARGIYSGATALEAALRAGRKA